MKESLSYKYFVNRCTIIVLVHFLLFIFFACTADEESLCSNEEKIPIIEFSSLHVGQSSTAFTRTMAADTYESGLPIGSRFDVFIYDSNSDPVPSDDEENHDPEVVLPLLFTTTGNPDVSTARSGINQIKKANADENTPLLSPKYPPTDDHDAFIFAVFPAMCTEEQALENSYSFSIQQNQTIPANIIASDLLASEMITQSMTGGKSVDIPMTHRMAKVIVKFNPIGSLTNSNMPTTFDLKGIKPTVTITPKSGTISRGTGSPITIKGSSTEALIIPPQTIAENSTLLQFDIAGTLANNFHAVRGVTFKLASAITFEANTVYEITVNVNINFITATATITPWSQETLMFNTKIL